MLPSPSVRLVYRPPTALLRAVGPDAAAFLQGQGSNDLRSLADGRSTYTLWLSPKGKAVADSWVLRESADVWWLLSLSSPVETLRQRLEAFLIADEVELTDETEAFAGALLWGDAAGAAEVGPEARSVAVRWAAGPGVFVFWRRNKEASCRSRLEAWLRARGGEVAGPAAAERARLEAGAPLVPQDIGPDDLPQEGGLEEEAISFTKGCFTGQEVMARLKSMGQTRRVLVRVRGAGAAPSALSPLFAGEKKVGDLRSTLFLPEENAFLGLALVQKLALARGGSFSFAPGGSDTVRVEGEGPA